ncbi:MAG: DUF262 domain-containing protein [Acidimicrobiaceae bacterium]|nr:DUF262 domain-containing protein [Chloroflexota bacterium]MCY3583902.1 DUF262 domain-containing protein [Chloroflexota bacterium]MCY3648592.1 DUF262 domain-containing protein [Acidimicrobiaceae bacterium]MDE2651895.1 DUF262 domain-containing protein [Chloroflexota bacterium]
MAISRNAAIEVEVWPVSKLMDAVAKNPSGNSRITIPPFQRRLVWNQQTRKALIDSIRNGYPFGSILLYEDVKRGQEAGDGRHHFSLIDGLQRTQALKDYVERQNGYFTRADLDDDFVDTIAKHLGKETDEHRDRIRSAIVEWVKGRRNFDAASGWSDSNLTKSLIEKVLRYPADSLLLPKMFFEFSSNDDFNRALGDFLDKTRSQVNFILDAKIPVLRFAGDASKLPEIFELINTHGTQLSKYEVFAARWIDERNPISNHRIIEAIWKKYDALADEGFALDVVEDAPDPAKRLTQEYSLFDFLFGFGQLLADDYPRLFTAPKDDRPSSAGFNLVTACVNLKIQDMDKLAQHIQGIDLDKLEQCIVESVKFVDRIMRPVLGPVRKYKAQPIFHSEMMIVAFIATVFQARYTINGLQENDTWPRDRKLLKRNLLMFYLSEILHDDWRGSGDSKVNDRLRDFRYLHLKPPSEERWRQILDDWYADHLIERSDRKQYILDKRTEYLLLRYIFADQLGPNAKYHVEHVIPTEQLLPLKPKNEGWLYNSISNLALIKDAGELKYNKETYVEILRRRMNAGEIDQNVFLQQCESFNRLLLCPPSTFPSKLTVNSYEGFLSQRWELLKNAFIKQYHNFIPAAPA